MIEHGQQAASIEPQMPEVFQLKAEVAAHSQGHLLPLLLLMLSFISECSAWSKQSYDKCCWSGRLHLIKYAEIQFDF